MTESDPLIAQNYGSIEAYNHRSQRLTVCGHLSHSSGAFRRTWGAVGLVARRG